MASYYDLLGISPDATPQEIKKAYIWAARQCHGDIPKTTELNQAREVLLNPEKRSQYDLEYQYGQQIKAVLADIDGSSTEFEIFCALKHGKELFTSILQKQPENVAVWWQLSNICHKMGEYDEELQILDRLEKLTKGESLLDVLRRKVQFYLFQEKPEEAIQILHRILEQNPSRTEDVGLLTEVDLKNSDEQKPAFDLFLYALKKSSGEIRLTYWKMFLRVLFENNVDQDIRLSVMDQLRMWLRSESFGSEEICRKMYINTYTWQISVLKTNPEEDMRKNLKLARGLQDIFNVLPLEDPENIKRRKDMEQLLKMLEAGHVHKSVFLAADQSDNPGNTTRLNRLIEQCPKKIIHCISSFRTFLPFFSAHMPYLDDLENRANQILEQRGESIPVPEKEEPSKLNDADSASQKPENPPKLESEKNNRPQVSAKSDTPPKEEPKQDLNSQKADPPSQSAESEENQSHQPGTSKKSSLFPGILAILLALLVGFFIIFSAVKYTRSKKQPSGLPQNSTISEVSQSKKTDRKISRTESRKIQKKFNNLGNRTDADLHVMQSDSEKPPENKDYVWLAFCDNPETGKRDIKILQNCLNDTLENELHHNVWKSFCCKESIDVDVCVEFYRLAENAVLQSKKEWVTVPDLTGCSLAEARRLLEEQQLSLGKVEECSSCSSAFEAGSVINQTIDAGKSVKIRSKISVQVCAGRKVKVPDLSGMYPDDALQVLDEQGLMLGKTEEVYIPNAESWNAGTIVGQSAEPGSMLQENGVIDVQICAGSEIQMPDLTGCTLKEASEILERQGLILGEVYDSDQYEEGHAFNEVLAQSVEPGETVHDGAEISLQVYCCPYVEVPYLRGYSLKEAKQILQDLGLELESVEEEYQYNADCDVGTVLRQSIRSQTRVDRGTEISLVVYAGGLVKIPDLKSKSVQQAKKDLEDAGLTAGSAEYVFAYKCPEDVIVWQSETPFSQTNPGTVVDYRISMGWDSVPDFDVIWDIVSGEGTCSALERIYGINASNWDRKSHELFQPNASGSDPYRGEWAFMEATASQHASVCWRGDFMTRTTLRRLMDNYTFREHETDTFYGGDMVLTIQPNEDNPKLSELVITARD